MGVIEILSAGKAGSELLILSGSFVSSVSLAKIGKDRRRRFIVERMCWWGNAK
jgi:hypothetical protein